MWLTKLEVGPYTPTHVLLQEVLEVRNGATGCCCSAVTCVCEVSHGENGKKRHYFHTDTKSFSLTVIGL